MTYGDGNLLKLWVSLVMWNNQRVSEQSTASCKRDGWKRELSLGTAETGRANGDSMWLLAMVKPQEMIYKAMVKAQDKYWINNPLVC